jgi:hypothetical protein
MRYFILILAAISVTGCVTTGNNSVSSEQELKKSPCACNDYQIFNGTIYIVEGQHA